MYYLYSLDDHAYIAFKLHRLADDWLDTHPKFFFIDPGSKPYQRLVSNPNFFNFVNDNVGIPIQKAQYDKWVNDRHVVIKQYRNGLFNGYLQEKLDGSVGIVTFKNYATVYDARNAVPAVKSANKQLPKGNYYRCEVIF